MAVLRSRRPYDHVSALTLKLSLCDSYVHFWTCKNSKQHFKEGVGEVGGGGVASDVDNAAAVLV